MSSTRHNELIPPAPLPARPMELDNGPAWPNRLVLAPLTNQQSNQDGTLHEDELRWLGRRAIGGFGMVMTCAAYVAPEGKAFPGQLGVWDDRCLPGLTQLATALRTGGAVSCVQLHHGGRRANPAVSGVPAVAPWDDTEHGARALTTAEIKGVVANFARAARRVQEAGFDGVEIHAGHGYLLAQFLDATRNTRNDEYGGHLTNRSRILLEVLEAVRGATEPGFQVGIRLSPWRYGIVLDESLVVAEQIMASGLVDYLDMSLWDVKSRPEEAQYGGQTLTELFSALPRHGTRLGVAGKITSAAAVQWCLDEGADFVMVGTGAILHHDFANRVLADPKFVSIDQPVSRRHLEAEDVGPRFIDYITSMWDDFVR
ncbi:NADH:flavin oxidoreductase [Arthrobacter sp. SLBN-100]|uniref:NADH:flavin oxidoreductase n=1 Tax=Arthrobacter sp. SLBN-100 TaxID=2768450 RepID=UPI001F45E3EE|nr:NADH:flavin oxidoreductase [Arthrobacter sp. SLBN-100]